MHVMGFRHQMSFSLAKPQFGDMCQFGFGGSPLFSLNFVCWKLQNLVCASFFSVCTNKLDGAHSLRETR